MYMSDSGWRARIGVLVPSTNTVVEQWFNRVAPQGVSFHTARMTIKHATAEGAREMGEGALAAAAQVADCQVDAIAYCCTAGVLSRGSHYENQLTHKITAAFGIPCITATAAIVMALRSMDMKRIASIVPYASDVHTLEVEYFQEHGIHLVHSKLMNIESLHDFSKPSAGDIYRLARDTSDECPDADGLFLGCMDFRAHDAIEALEMYTGKPVVTALQATLWAILRLAGIKDAISGYGRLFITQ